MNSIVKMKAERLEEMRKNFWESSIRNWDYYIEEVKQQPDIPETTKERVIENIREIQSAFGDGWIENAFKPLYHPLFSYFMNMAPWSRLSICEFGTKLKTFRNYKNFETILARLKNKEHFLGAKLELDIAYVFHSNGFDFEFVTESSSKSPDLKLKKENVFIEITRIVTAEEHEKGVSQLNDIMYSVIPAGINISFSLHKVLANNVLKEIKEEVKNKVKYVKENKKCWKLHKKGVIDLLLFPKEKTEYYKKWKKKYNSYGGCSGAPVNIDQTKRIKRKIKEKSEQIGTDNLGIVVIDISEVLFGNTIHDYFDIADKVDQELFDHDNLLACVLIGSPFGFFNNYKEYDKRVIRQEDYVLRFKKEGTESKRPILFIKNKYCKHDDSELVEELFK
jgi:hypothetical protein